jgi:hypothetical protein
MHQEMKLHVSVGPQGPYRRNWKRAGSFPVLQAGVPEGRMGSEVSTHRVPFFAFLLAGVAAGISAAASVASS